MYENCDNTETRNRTKYEYDAFGNQISHTGTTSNNMLYRGEQYDSDLGLYYLRARFYNPMLDRFVSRDPNDGHLTDPITLHKYLYADGDPVNGSDPTGRAVAINYRIGIAIGLGATAGVIAFRNAVNCKYNWNATDFSANVTAGAFGSTWQTGPCSWEGSPPTVYPLPFPFPISTPAPWGPYGQPGSCDSGAGEEWHHLVPQAERPWAEGCGFNIDQPGLGMCIKGSCHDQIHGNSNGTNWNAAWQYQIDNVWGRDQCPSVQQLVSFAQSLAVQFADDIMCQ